MSATNFSFDLQDANFVLFDQLGMDKHLAAVEAFSDFDREVYTATVEQAYKLARETLDPINRSGDHSGCVFDGKGGVTTPAGYREAWQAFAQGGWSGACAPVDLGGQGLPHVVGAALADIFSGSAMAFNMYPLLANGAANVIRRHAPGDLKNLIAEKLFTGVWGGTMCLTEANAGSAVGDNKTKATPSGEEGVWLLEGEKIFISGGDHDLTENIVHLVLARTPGSPTGTKGLSLFIVPKFNYDPKTLALGERNGAYVLRIEEKMGIHGSCTCVLGLGQSGPCRGVMVGGEHQGIALMFEMMNEARIGVGMQGVATATAAYQYALHYANDRLQGPSMRDARDPNARSVLIKEHPDVRRMLMTLKVQAETLRALGYRIHLEFDLAHGVTDPEVAARHARRVDLLTPVVKSMATDLGFESACTAVQVYGGYGFISEYPVEQLVRDAKIQSIYEGTNGIQSLDLIGRKLRIEGGRLFVEWMEDIQRDCKAAAEEGFAEQAKALGSALEQLGAAAAHIGQIAKSGALEASVVNAVNFQRAMGWVALGHEALDQARVARRLIDGGTSNSRLTGKLLNLDFLVGSMLPYVGALTKVIRSADTSCLDPALFNLE